MGNATGTPSEHDDDLPRRPQLAHTSESSGATAKSSVMARHRNQAVAMIFGPSGFLELRLEKRHMKGFGNLPHGHARVQLQARRALAPVLALTTTNAEA